MKLNLHSMFNWKYKLNVPLTTGKWFVCICHCILTQFFHLLLISNWKKKSNWFKMFSSWKLVLWYLRLNVFNSMDKKCHLVHRQIIFSMQKPSNHCSSPKKATISARIENICTRKCCVRKYKFYLVFPWQMLKYS